MSNDAPELGKGLFGYRKSAVNQIIADRDSLLRQAEGRVRAAESRVEGLQGELASMRAQNDRMNQQLERLQEQLDALARAQVQGAGASWLPEALNGADAADGYVAVPAPADEPALEDADEVEVELEETAEAEETVEDASPADGATGQGEEAPPAAEAAEDEGPDTGIPEEAGPGDGEPEARVDEPEPVGETGPMGREGESGQPGSARPAGDATSRFLEEELASVLRAAEESAARIMDKARIASEEQTERATRLWRQVQDELTRFAAWRQEIEPVIHAVQSKVDGVRAQIEEVPERIRQALTPMADAISSIDGDLHDLSSASTPPVLTTPTGLEEGELGWDAPAKEPGDAADGAGDDGAGENEQA